MKKNKIDVWVEKNAEALKSIFEDFCDDTNTKKDEENFLRFSAGMYLQCKH